jgi:hypothetical protein
MEEEKPSCPVAISLFQTTDVMMGSQHFAKTIEQLWEPDGICGFLFCGEGDFLSCLQTSPQ